MRKTRFLIMFIMILILLLGLVGCDDLGLNYITVVVQSQVCAEVGDFQWEGAQVSIEINKAGGERVTFDKITDANGCTDIVEATFNVYKEQFVEIIARPITGQIPQDYWDTLGEEYDPLNCQVFGNSSRLLWSTISKDNKFGDTYYWNPTVQIQVLQK